MVVRRVHVNGLFSAHIVVIKTVWLCNRAAHITQITPVLLCSVAAQREQQQREVWSFLSLFLYQCSRVTGIGSSSCSSPQYHLHLRHLNLAAWAGGGWVSLREHLLHSSTALASVLHHSLKLVEALKLTEPQGCCRGQVLPTTAKTWVMSSLNLFTGSSIEKVHRKR